MTRDVSRKGKPVIALVAVLAAWVLARAMLWQSPFPQLPDVAPLLASTDRGGGIEEFAPSRTVDDRMVPPMLSVVQPSWSPSQSTPVGADYVLDEVPYSPPEPLEFVAGHQLMYLSALRRVPIPPEVAHMMRQSAVGPGGPSRTQVVQEKRELDRWSLDTWLFQRPGGSGNTSGPLPSTYGASQAGAVLRYQLNPESKRNASAFLRLTTALDQQRDREAALGVSARPIAKLPVSALAEVRLRQSSRGTEIRPAALAVTEVAPIELSSTTRAEFYAQGGYVGGDFATGFADGQVRVTREVGDFDLGEFRVGAGAWGGAQRGAARLDIGPTASLDVKVGDTPARLAVDYRLRVAGDAEPGSGVALTLSTGF